MSIYYTLLLSFSEQVGFNIAYLIASVAPIVLITVFPLSLLKNRSAAIFILIYPHPVLHIYIRDHPTGGPCADDPQHRLIYDSGRIDVFFEKDQLGQAV